MNSPLSAKQLTALNHVQWTRYIQVASLTLLLHDHLITLPEEVDLVWRGARAKSWPRILFFASRYACPIALIINTVALLDTRTSDELFVYDTMSRPSDDKNPPLGQAWILFHGWSGYCFFAGVQVISQMRLWAMYRSRKLLTIMTILCASSLLVMGLIEGFGFLDIKVSSDPIPGLIHICGPKAVRKFVWAFWLSPLVIEFVAIILVVYKAIVYFRQEAPEERNRSGVITSIVRHSIFYFVVVFGVYLANLIIWKRLTVKSFELAIPLTYALPTVAGNRMLLSLRTIFYSEHSTLPGQNDIDLTVINPNRGVTVKVHNPLKEFDSFFGEISRS